MYMCSRGIALAHLSGPIYAVGGLDDTACFSIVERYDPESDCWTTIQSMNSEIPTDSLPPPSTGAWNTGGLGYISFV